MDKLCRICNNFFKPMKEYYHTCADCNNGKIDKKVICKKCGNYDLNYNGHCFFCFNEINNFN